MKLHVEIDTKNVPFLVAILKEGMEVMDDIQNKTDVYLGINEARLRAERWKIDVRKFLGLEPAS